MVLVNDTFSHGSFLLKNVKIYAIFYDKLAKPASVVFPINNFYKL